MYEDAERVGTAGVLRGGTRRRLGRGGRAASGWRRRRRTALARHAEGLAWARPRRGGTGPCWRPRRRLREAERLSNLATVHHSDGRLRAGATDLRARPRHRRAGTRSRPPRRRCSHQRPRVPRWRRPGRASPRSLYERALAINENGARPGSPEQSRVNLNNLAGILPCGTSSRARCRCRSVHSRSVERAFGPDHPEVANSLMNLASVYAGLGRPHPGYFTAGTHRGHPREGGRPGSPRGRPDPLEPRRHPFPGR